MTDRNPEGADQRTLELLRTHHAEQMERAEAFRVHIKTIGGWLHANATEVTLTVADLDKAISDLSADRDLLAGAERDAACYEQLAWRVGQVGPTPIEVEARAAVSQPMSTLPDADHPDSPSPARIGDEPADVAGDEEAGQ